MRARARLRCTRVPSTGAVGPHGPRHAHSGRGWKSKNPVCTTEFWPIVGCGPLAEVGLRRQYDAESATKRERTHVKTFSSSGRSRVVSSAFRVARDASAHTGHGLY